jgi:hypothetical protein
MSAILQPHLLFNIINQNKPTFYADFRGEIAFRKCRIRGSTEICILSKPAEVIYEHLIRVTEKNSVIVVCIFDRNSAAAADETSTFVKNATMKNILSVELLNFDDFYCAYPRCAFLFLGTDFPDQTMRKPAKEYPTDIVPQFLYLGSYYDASDESIVSHLKITHIVDATGAKLSCETATKLGVSYLPIHIWDMEGCDIAQHFDAVLAFIDSCSAEPQGRIIVHCRAGISRSSTFVLAYLMKKRLVDSLQSALQLVIGERPFVLPNPSFRDQLRAYEMALFAKTSFADDAAMMAYISTMNHCWSGMFTKETDFDRIPIVFANKSAKALTHMDEFPSEAAASAEGDSNPKPKNTFLKRGSGKKSSVLEPK